MALTPAEKQRRYREKRDKDPARRAAYLAKEQQKYKDDKECGKRKLVCDMTSRQLRRQRRQWRNKKKSSRKRKADSMNEASQNTPGPSKVDPSRQLASSRGRAKREKAKCYQANKELKVKLIAAEKKAELYRKRWERTVNTKKSSKQIPQTPRTKANSTLKYSSAKTVKKTLIFHNALLDQLKQNILEKAERKTIKSIAAGAIMRKYGLQKVARTEIGVTRLRGKTPKKGSLTKRLMNKIKEFYERDDVSRITTGVKNTVTRKKSKQQKRLLSDTMENLFKKFQAENKIELSYTTFTRLRPFWIVSPTEKDRNTCACKLCENTEYLTEALFKEKAIPNRKAEDLLHYVTCSESSKKCMYGECSECHLKMVPMAIPDAQKEVTWKQWKSIKEERILKNGEKKDVVLTVKADENGTIDELRDKFHEQIWRFRRHVFNITNQHRHYKHIKEGLKESECFLHIDFAENYVSKCTSEIQSMHFGASKNQITLHTGYYKVGSKEEHSVSFCGVSDSLQHDPAAIWTYLSPILRGIKEKCPEVEVLHFYSDGLTPQYRQKSNFFLFSTEVFELGYKEATWNFLEAGHRKGIPDGVGGSLKRTADTCVHHGKNDITDAASFIHTLQTSKTSVELYEIHQSDIKQMEEKLKSKNLKTVPGTMKLHQLITRSWGTVQYRDVSCTCIENECVDHKLQSFSFEDKADGTLKRKRAASAKANPENRAESQTKGEKDKNKKRRRHTKLNGQKINLGQSMNIEESSNVQEEETSEHVRNEPTVSTEEHRDEPKVEANMENTFHNLLLSFLKCKTFEELQILCANTNFRNIAGEPRYILEEGIEVDHTAIDVYPADVEDNTTRFPVAVKADGDCLPASGSVYAFGQDHFPDEIRARIVIELTLNKDYYLNIENLKRGLPNEVSGKNIKKAFAMYAEEYTPGSVLTELEIERIYQKEVMNIARPKSYMGIWQLFALSSVLQMPIYSVYPMLGNPVVRKDLNRMILPRTKVKDDVAFILWTSTRKDLASPHWIPNHFVPVLPIERVLNVYEANENESGSDSKESVGSGNEGGESGTEAKESTILEPGKQSEAETRRSAGSDKDIWTDSKDSAGSDEDIGADSKDSAGSDKDIGADSKDSAGSDKDIWTDSKDSAGSDKDIGADSKDSAGSDEDIGADSKDSAGSDKDIGADSKDSVGSDKDIGADSKDSAGSDKDIGADSKDSAGSDKDIGADSKDSAGSDKDIGADSKDSVGSDKDIGADSNERVGLDDGYKDIGTETGQRTEMVKGGEESESVTTESLREVTDPQDCLGKYVVVLYDGLPYPGYVEEAGFDDVYVNCMHLIGKKSENNCFYWPRKIKDKCWYLYENIVSLIPEPSKIEGSYSHFQVDPTIWREILDKVLKE